MTEVNCTLLLNPIVKGGSSLQPSELSKKLESSDDKDKIEALKICIINMLTGEDMGNLLMTVIRFCITSENHQLKKLLQIYWETVPKCNPDGTLKPEMILVCNALRNDLNHPNEYIRGCCLRFLCKIREPELLEPLVASVKANLTHRSVYVRRNAVMTVVNIFKHFEETLLPDGAELIVELLGKETDRYTRRNAFLMLFHAAQDKAVEYLVNNLDNLSDFGDGFKLVVLELVRKVCREDPSQKGLFLKAIFSMLNANSAAVSFEAAATLVSLSSAPTAIRAAATTYTQLLNSQSDNNVKLVILERLEKLKKFHGKVLSDLLLDILRVLSSRNNDIRQKTLDIAMDLINSRNIEEVMSVLKKEVSKTQESGDNENGTEYRAMLIQAIHSCAVKFPDVANSVVHLLMDFLNADGASDVIRFVREIVETYQVLRDSVLAKLISLLPTITDPDVIRSSLWVLGEYSVSEAQVASFADIMKVLIGPMPLDFSSSSSSSVVEEVKPTESKVSSGPKINADGTYAYESSLSTPSSLLPPKSELDKLPVIRRLLLTGDFFLGSVIGAALTKVALRILSTSGPSSVIGKNLSIFAISIISGIVTFGKGKLSPRLIEDDSIERFIFCVRSLLDPSISASLSPLWLSDCRGAFKHLLNLQQESKPKTNLDEAPVSEPDGGIIFRQLRAKRKILGSNDLELDDAAEISKATEITQLSAFTERLSRTFQLTGSGDPVYAEAHVATHDYDIVLDILVINRTSLTLTNLNVDLATKGPLKIVERPQSYTVAPGQSIKTKVTIKVSSTETSHIFGNLVFDTNNNVDTTVLNLNDINIDIMDYIKPATASDFNFRNMWAEFEWENKVSCNTEITNVQDFVNHIVNITNMKCLTPTSALGGECNFLAANLYAKSVFGEDALLNVSVASGENGKISGFIRIRSKTQGIALSLGDRITAKQKSVSD